MTTDKLTAETITDTPTDPLLGFSPDEIVVGPAGQTLAQAATPQRRISDGGEIRCGDLMGPHDGVRLCGACSQAAPDERTIPCGDLIEMTIETDTTAVIPRDDAASAQLSQLDAHIKAIAQPHQAAFAGPIFAALGHEEEADEDAFRWLQAAFDVRPARSRR